jgi:hypothetical protein
MERLFSEDVSGTQIPMVEADASVLPPFGQYDAIRQQEEALSSGLLPTPYLQQPFVYQPMMANQPSSIVGGMFSPEISRAAEMEFMQKRQAAMQNEALAYAQLTPMQQAQFGFYRGGQQLGDALGGALGGQDPQLKLISQRQRLLSQLDRSDPESYKKIALQAQQTGDSELATLVSEAGRKLELDTSLIKQRLREKEGADPFEQLLRSGKYTPASMATYKLSKNVADLREVNNPDKIPAKIQEAQTVAKNKGFTEGTPEFNAEVVNYLERPEKETQVQQLQNYRKKLRDSNAPASDIAEVDAAIKALAEGNAPKIIMPGQQVAPKDWLAFSSQISKDPVMDRTSTILADAPSAIETIRMSATNDIAAASLPGSLARLTGEGKNMSNQDVNRFARTGGLDDRLAQDAVGFFTGRKTNVTKEQAERFATAVYRGALLERKKFIKDQAEQAGYDKTPNYEIAIRQLDDQLAKFQLITPKDKSAPAPKLDADSLVNKYLQPK